MTNDMMIYFICAGICLVIITIATIIIAKTNLKSKKKMAGPENERQFLNMERNKFASEQAQLRKAQEDLKNAQIIFQKEKEAKANLIF